MSKYLKKFLVAGAALLLVASTGLASASSVSAKRRSHYHYRTTKVYKRHAKKPVRRNRRHAKAKRYVKRIKQTKRMKRSRKSRFVRTNVHKRNRKVTRKPKLRKRMTWKTVRKNRRKAHKSRADQEFEDEMNSYRVTPAEAKASNNAAIKQLGLVPMKTHAQINKQLILGRQQMINDINQDRASVGESPLTENADLDNIAQERANQLKTTAFTHTDPNTGNAYATEDGIDNVTGGNWGENLATEEACTDSGYDLSGKQVANEANQDLFTDEKPTADNPNGGGHYQNIINGTQVGVGISYVPNTSYYVAEDFQN